MARYHLTAGGDPGLCRAQQGRCPYGGSREHYESPEEARESYEAAQSMDALLGQSLKKNPRFAAMEEAVERKAATRARLYREYAERALEVQEEFGDLSHEELERYNQAYRAFEPKLTPEEKEEFHNYTGIFFDPANSYLRDREAFLAEARPEFVEKQVRTIEKALPLLDAALSKAPAEPRRLFRRLDQKDGLLSSEEWADSLGFQEGQEVTFAAYSSTTVNPGYINRTVQGDEHTSVVLALSTSKGAPVDLTVYDRPRTHTQEGEAEILLPRNSSYRVTKVERAGYSSGGFERVEVLTVFLEEL